MNPASGATELGRREFLKLSAGSAALLSAGAFSATLAGCAKHEAPAAGYRFLRSGDIALFAAIAPVVLGSSLPSEQREVHLATLLKAIDGAGVPLQAPGQKMVYQLFDLLNTGLTRRLTTGVSKPWPQAEPAEIAVFLDRWQNSSIGLFNAGYRALSKFVIGSWIGTPQGLKAVGYPGPWAPMYAAINA
ncbi:MAG: hypothetical protein Q8Q73_15755 [Stagnimonas sp.]|nr:hypothetical protein [Stagnimonas sp.]